MKISYEKNRLRLSNFLEATTARGNAGATF